MQEGFVMQKEIVTTIFGLACLFWAIILSLGFIADKNTIIAENKTKQYCALTGILYLLGILTILH